MATQLSLKERILVAKSSVSLPTPQVFVASRRPSTYKAWREDSLYKAYLAHIQDGLSVRQAAEAYGVPKSTLQDRVSGRVQFGVKSGPPKLLTDAEESELVSFVCGCVSVGYAKSKQEILSLVRSIVHSKGVEGVCVTDGWWTSFKRRHGQLTLRAAEPLSYARAVASSPQIISSYYDLLEQTLTDNDLLSSPSQIYNMDETGMPLDPTPPKIVTVRGVKHPVKVTTGNKSQITCVSACSASGQVLPPMIIFDRQSLKPELTYGEVPGTTYGLSKKGWIDGELFDLWFKEHFLPNASPLRPLLLIMDGHSTHYQPSVVRLAASEQVVLFCLPPNITHLTQPLDKGCFSPLKSAWRKECHEFLAQNPGRVVTRYEFSQLFSKAWFASMTPKNAISGFRCTGIFPFNREAIQLPTTGVVDRVSSLAQETGLNFIPLYTCSPSKKSVTSSAEETSAASEDDPPSACLQRQTSVTKCLAKVNASIPLNLMIREKHVKDCGRVLTSAENLKRIKEKEEKKREKELEKEEKKREKELEKELKKQKQREKELEKELKKQKQLEKVSLKQAKKQTLTPAKLPKRRVNSVVDTEKVPVFTDSEWSLFERRQEEGYDLIPTGRYKLWLEIYHPEANSSDSGTHAADVFQDVSHSDVDISLAVNTEVVPVFTNSEWSLFERRQEEGYDLIPTGRYKLWLEIYHPEANSSDSGAHANDDVSDSDVDISSDTSKRPAVTRKAVSSGKNSLCNEAVQVADEKESGVQRSQATMGRSRRTAPRSASCLSPVTSGDTRKRPAVARKAVSSGKNSLCNEAVQVADENKSGVQRSQATMGRSRKTAPRSTSCLSPVTSGDTRKRPAVTRKAVSKNKSGVQRSQATMGRSRRVGLCVSRTCTNMNEPDWVQCDDCGEWYHCLCVGVSMETAKKSRFVCCS